MGWIAWVALVPLFVAIQYSTARGAFLLTFFASFIWYMSSIFWTFHAMYVYGGVELATSILLMLLSVVILAVFISLAPMFAVLIGRRWRGEAIIWLPVTWVAVEFLRNYFPCGGFPWSNIAMSQWRMIPFIQIVDIVGVYGLIFLMVFVNQFVAECVLRIRGNVVGYLLPKGVVTAFLVIALLVYGTWRIHGMRREMEKCPTVQVGIIQGNIPQEDKWDSDKAERSINVYRDAVAELGNSPVDIIVWPEASFPWYIKTDFTGLNPRVLGLDQNILGPLPYTLLGAISETPAGDFYNSAILLNAQGDIAGRYHKVHLAPFGEYIPYEKILFFAKKLTKPAGSFLAGDENIVFSTGEFKFAPLICYEDVFPEISRKAVRNGAEFLVNMTNNAWFGQTAAPYQQLALSVFRSVENRRYLLRSTNTGISAIVDPTGRILVESGMFEPAIMVANVGRLHLQSLYSELGDWFAWGCAAYAAFGIVIISILGLWRSRKHGSRDAGINE